MSETAKRYSLQFTELSPANTDTSFIVADSSGTVLIQHVVVQNNGALDNSVKVKVQYGGNVVFTKTYTVYSNSSLFLSEIITSVLYGDATFPDKITLSIGVTLSAGETIDCIASGVEFI